MSSFSKWILLLMVLFSFFVMVYCDEIKKGDLKKEFTFDKDSLQLIFGIWRAEGRGGMIFTKSLVSKNSGFKFYRFYGVGGEGSELLYTILKSKKDNKNYIYLAKDDQSSPQKIRIKFKGNDKILISTGGRGHSDVVVLDRVGNIEENERSGLETKWAKNPETLDKNKLDLLLKKKWKDMKKALMNQDVEKAVKYFAHESRKKYKKMFTALHNKLPEIGREMKDIKPVVLEKRSAKYRLIRKENIKGKTYDITYAVYFVVDFDGVWRILRY